MENKHLSTLIWILAIAWAILLIIYGTIPLTPAFFKPISFITAIAIFLIRLFDKWIWKWKLLYPWFVDIPNLSGTWRASINSTWIDQETGENLKDIEAYFIIQQTFSDTKVTLLTRESKSELIGGKLLKNNDTYSITGVYLNKPKLLNIEKSPIHYGALLCEVNFNKGNPVIDGSYWTARGTKGEIKFLDHDKKIYPNFDECKKFYNSQDQ